MAKNIVQDHGGQVRRQLDLGGAASSGDVVLVGEGMNVLALEDTDASDLAVCMLPPGTVINGSVTGADGAGNAAIAIGDILYNDSGTINADDTNGVACGFALAAVSSGATSTIDWLYTG